MNMNNALSMPAPSMPSPMPKGKKTGKKSDDGNRGELSMITIEPAENGFCIRSQFEPKKLNPKISRYDQMPEPEEMVFESSETALAYVSKMMTGAVAAEATEDE